MDDRETVIDSPADWVAAHIREYVDSDGAKGGNVDGLDILLITTRGRVTGQLRRTALIFGRDEDHYVVVASNGGDDKHPYWYTNLQADPTVTLQVGAERFTATARTATEPERSRLFEQMAEIFPRYTEFQRKTAREIPVVVLDRA